ncbi:MAG: DUF4160 domain-containing protein [Chlorobiales bacterium]|nr:DUF4160 domain-containing protein [Chlorobiales bacterium]
MPTIKQLSNGFRFFFFSFDCNEPIHAHLSSGKKICKFWIEPVSLAKNNGFSSKELNTVYKQIQANNSLIKECWYEHCGHY